MKQPVQVTSVVEEEYCLIPMGGVLPRRDQRVIGIGGTAGMVHPSTGYMVARTLGAVPQLADRVVDEVSSFKQHGDSRGVLYPVPRETTWLPVFRTRKSGGCLYRPCTPCSPCARHSCPGHIFRNNDVPRPVTAAASVCTRHQPTG